MMHEYLSGKTWPFFFILLCIISPLSNVMLCSLKNLTVLFSPGDWLNAAGALSCLTFSSPYKAMNRFWKFWLAGACWLGRCSRKSGWILAPPLKSSCRSYLSKRQINFDSTPTCLKCSSLIGTGWEIITLRIIYCYDSVLNSGIQ